MASLLLWDTSAIVSSWTIWESTSTRIISVLHPFIEMTSQNRVEEVHVSLAWLSSLCELLLSNLVIVWTHIQDLWSSSWEWEFWAYMWFNSKSGIGRFNLVCIYSGVWVKCWSACWGVKAEATNLGSRVVDGEVIIVAFWVFVNWIHANTRDSSIIEFAHGTHPELFSLLEHLVSSKQFLGVLAVTLSIIEISSGQLTSNDNSKITHSIDVILIISLKLFGDNYWWGVVIKLERNSHWF